VPTTSEHLGRAEHNLKFAQSFDLATTPYLDWVVTAYFYSALHLVDALLYEKDRLHGGVHQQRKQYLVEKSYLRGIKNVYRTLNDRSVEARYTLLTFTKLRVENQVIPLYTEIRNHILQQMRS
jgi:uncharacterized protein (UPF0332 family)